MKTIVILDNLFGPDMIKSFNYLKDNLNMKKYNLISPLMFMKIQDKDNQLLVKMMASAISLGNMYNEFGTIKSIAQENKITIYYGIAHKNIKADKILVVNPVALDAQEFLLDKYIKESNVTFNYIKSNQAEKSFSKIEEALEFIHDLQ
jgi:hypothetical protein